MQLFKEGSDRTAHCFIFDVDIKSPLVFSEWEIDCQSCEMDGDIEKSMMEAMRRVHKELNCHGYLVVASHDVSRSSKLRTKKGVVWARELLGSLNSRVFEAGVNGRGETRLGSVIDLADFSYSYGENVLLNWVYGFLVFTSLDIDSFLEYARGWLSGGENSALGFDYASIAHDVMSLSSTAIVRCFPPDNGRSAKVAIMCNEFFMRNVIEKVALKNGLK